MIGDRLTCLVKACLVVLAVSHVGAASLSTGWSAPAVLWGAGPYIRAGVSGERSRVSYQVAGGDDLVRSVVHGLLPTAAAGAGAARDDDSASLRHYFDDTAVAAATPDVIVVCIGTQVQSAVMRGSDGASVLQPLQRLLAAAAASLTVPHVRHDVRHDGDVAVSLSQRIGDDLRALANVTHAFDFMVVGGCEGEWEGVQQHASVLHALHAASHARTTIMLQCLTAQHDNGAALQHAAAHEVSQLVETSQVLEESGQRYAMLFVVDPQHDAAQHGTAQRALLASGDVAASSSIDYRVCDAKCKAQVGVMEALLLAMILSLATAAGLWLQYILHTPTRFQTPSTASD